MKRGSSLLDNISGQYDGVYCWQCFMALSISQKPLTPGNNVEIKCSEESNINGANINGANRQKYCILGNKMKLKKVKKYSLKSSNSKKNLITN